MRSSVNEALAILIGFMVDLGGYYKSLLVFAWGPSLRYLCYIFVLTMKQGSETRKNKHCVSASHNCVRSFASIFDMFRKLNTHCPQKSKFDSMWNTLDNVHCLYIG